jgi:cytochrome c oxidase subunit 4
MTVSGNNHDSSGSQHGSSRFHVHAVPLWLLLAVFLALIVLTVVTVAVTKVDLGKANLWIAMLIAGIKATLVALYFMHLRWDKLFHGIIFLGAIAFVVLFIGIALMDTQAYHPDIIPGYAPGIEQ